MQSIWVGLVEAAAVVVACGVLWYKAVKPAWHLLVDVHDKVSRLWKMLGGEEDGESSDRDAS